MTISDEHATASDGDELEPAIRDASTRRHWRARVARIALLAAAGLALVATNPVLSSVARARERSFATHADLVVAVVVDTHEGTVTVRWHDRDVEYVGDVVVVSSGAYDEGEEVAVLADPDSGTVHLPGSAIDFLDFPLAPVHTFGWIVGVGVLAIAGWLGWKTHRIAKILRAHPWRTVPLRWVMATDSLVGGEGDDEVEYAAKEPGHRTVEIAGPARSVDRARSVFRGVGSSHLELVKGPRPVKARPVILAPDAVGWSFPRGSLSSERAGKKKREVRTDQGVLVAILERPSAEYVSFRDSAGHLQLELRGEGKGVKVFDAQGGLIGMIDFRFRSAEAFTIERTPVASVRLGVKRGEDLLSDPTGTVLGSISYNGSLVPERSRAVVSVTADLPPRARTLVTALALTARWKPKAAGGGGA